MPERLFCVVCRNSYQDHDISYVRHAFSLAIMPSGGLHLLGIISWYIWTMDM